MGYSFEKTHNRILESAKKSFIQYGFSGASIRQICKDAGVTNGAFYSHFESKEDLFAKLVDPVIGGMNELYTEEYTQISKPRSAKEFEKVIEQGFASDKTMIHYIYEHEDVFRLLLTASKDTVYEKLPEKIAECETEGTIEFLNQCIMFIGKPENISDVLINRISTFVVNTAFESFLEGNSEEETIRQTQLATEFCVTGLKKVIGI
ncbi:MAG: TetR/AcrR family transcriptional regulator [Saccharofermentans sp.]|nr:TetR/AcrR family transcriptional regulator [Saccharofermentans sp.]